MEALIRAKNIIKKSQNILLLPAPESQGDSLGSSLALFFTLKKLGKNVNLLTDSVPEKLQFLLGLEKDSADFIIAIDTKKNPISKLHYEKDENNLKIYLTPKDGKLAAENVSFACQGDKSEAEINRKWPRERKIDLAVTLGADSLESLGEQFKENAEILSQTPILNIDNQSFNESFGEVNLTEITSSLAEITTGLIEVLGEQDKELVDQRITTALLTGIVWSSQNFRDPRTRPKTFEAAAKLIERGADHQKIIYHLYKQKDISQIKLLGRILEKLNLNKEKQLYSASLTEKDFKDCQATSKDLGFAVEELKLNFRFFPNLLILWESHASPLIIKGIFHSPDPELIERILESFEGISRGSSILFLVRGNDLSSAHERILEMM